MVKPLVHYVQLNQSLVGWQWQLAEREPQVAADEEKHQSEERPLRGCVPEEEVAEEVLHCIQNSIAVYITCLNIYCFQWFAIAWRGIGEEGKSFITIRLTPCFFTL